MWRGLNYPGYGNILGLTKRDDEVSIARLRILLTS
jgi:hypothetical protein